LKIAASQQLLRNELTQTSAFRRIELYKRLELELESEYDRQHLYIYADPTKQNKLAAGNKKRIHAEWEAIKNARKEVEHGVTSHLKSGIKIECRLLLERMHARLPRELRDMVYGFIVAGRPALIKKSDVCGSTIDQLHNLMLDSPLSRALESQGYGSLVGGSTIPGDTLRELAEIWYKTSVFCFEDPYALHAFAPYLNNFEKLLPHVSKEQQNLDLNPCALVKAVEITKKIWHGARTDHQFLDLVQGLKITHELKACKSIRLFLDFGEYDEDLSEEEGASNRLAHGFKIVFPTIRRLIEAGVKFSVCLFYTIMLDITLERLNVDYWVQRFREFSDVSLLSNM
jgi:hypothetical protein